MLQKLKEMVGDTGEVITQYGGYSITVKDHKKFPWYDVCALLIDEEFAVWIEKDKSVLKVVSKPAAVD